MPANSHIIYICLSYSTSVSTSAGVMANDKEPDEGGHLSKDEADRGCCTNGYFDDCCRPVFAEFVGSLIYIFVAGMTVQSADVSIISTGQGMAILMLAITFTPVR